MSRPAVGLFWIAFLLAAFVSLGTTRADETNVISPIASFQFLEAMDEPGASNAMVSPLVSFQFLDALDEPGSSNTIISPVVSYLYEDALDAPGAATAIISPIISYQYYDWPGDKNLVLQSSPKVSYYFQSGSGELVTLHGRVTALNGAALAGAIVSLAVGQSAIQQSATGAGGDYAFMPVGSGNYVITVTAPGFANAGRPLTVGVATAAQNFQLRPLGPPPATASGARPLPTAFTRPPTGPQGATLKVFQAGGFVGITSETQVDTNQPTVVLTHGWTRNPFCQANAGILGWPTDLAQTMTAQGISPGVANILAWDWTNAAQFTGVFCPVPPEENTPRQGVALGSALQAALGPGYAQPVHFIGHSLGTLVNAAAANYLHGHRTATPSQEVAGHPWRPDRTHLTLFDEAEVSSALDGQAIFDGLVVGSVSTSAGVLLYRDEIIAHWKHPLPLEFAWADNYVSLVGFAHENAVNVILERAFDYYSANLMEWHSYPQHWYSNTVVTPLRSILGFRHSQEYMDASGGGRVPPMRTDFSEGVVYDQSPLGSDPLALRQLPFSSRTLSGSLANRVVSGIDGVTVVAGNVAAAVEEQAGRAGQALARGFALLGEGMESLGGGVIDAYHEGIVRFEFGGGASGAGGSSVEFLTGGAKSGTETNAGSMAWIPLQVPSGAVALAFDFSVNGDPKDDLLVCGIGETNLFTLEARYIPTNQFSPSRLMDVSLWNGQSVELFIGFLGGTSPTNCALTVENIRFYSLESPRLEIALVGGVTVLNWPGTASGYVLESTRSLSSPEWEPATNFPAVVGSRYMLTNSWSDHSRFFRLRTR